MSSCITEHWRNISMVSSCICIKMIQVLRINRELILVGTLTHEQRINWIKRLEIAEDAAKGLWRKKNKKLLFLSYFLPCLNVCIYIILTTNSQLLITLTIIYWYSTTNYIYLTVVFLQFPTICCGPSNEILLYWEISHLLQNNCIEYCLFVPIQELSTFTRAVFQPLSIEI